MRVPSAPASGAEIARVDLRKNLQPSREPDADDRDTATRDKPAAIKTPPADDARQRVAVGIVHPIEHDRACEPSSLHRAASSSHVESTGTNVLDRRYDAIIAKPTASDSGTNSAWAAPCMKNDGTNTARMQSMASSRGTAVSTLPWRTAGATDRVPSILRVNVLDFDRRFVDQNADRQGQAAQRHQVDRLAREPERDDRAADANGMLRTTTIALRQSRKKDQHHQPGRAARPEPLRSARLRTARVTVGDWSNSKLTLMSSGSTACIFGSASLTLRTTRQRRGVGPLGHQDVNRPPAVDERITGGDVAGVFDGRHVAQVDRRRLLRAAAGSCPGPGRRARAN